MMIRPSGQGATPAHSVSTHTATAVNPPEVPASRRVSSRGDQVDVITDPVSGWAERMDEVRPHVDNALRVGFVGVGAIATAIVDALMSGPHAAEIDVVLSPRSAPRSAELAARHRQVRVAPDNQLVVDAADIVILAVLPDLMAALCSSLSFRKEQIVVSLAAGCPPSLLAERVDPAATVCQMIPLPMIALHTGPVVICPRVRRLEYLLEGCGEVVSLEREENLIVLSCASGTMSTFLEFENTVIDWAIKYGLDAQTAKDYVVGLFLGLATETMHTGLDRLPDMPHEHETPGGLNEYIRQSLTTANVFTELANHLDHLHRTRDPAGHQQIGTPQIAIRRGRTDRGS
jgi:pyrroline-5-carboxylate reductase